MSKPAGRSMRPDIQVNTQRPCAHARCTKPRHGIGKYCAAHGKASKLYGSPTAKRVRRFEYKTELKEVRAIIRKNRENPAVVEALRFLEDWLQRAARGERVPAREQMDHIYTAGAGALDVLTEVAAVWLFYMRRPHHYDDGPELTMQLAAAVIHLRARRASYLNKDGSYRYRPVGAIARKECGGLIRERLGFLLNSISQRVFQDELEAKQRVEVLRTPLS